MTYDLDMRKFILLAIIMLLALLSAAGCQMSFSFYGKDTQGRPVEPYYEEEGSVNQGRSLEGRFSLLRSRVEVNNAAFTADGSRAIICSGERLVLLDQEGNLLWEKDFDESLLEAGWNNEGTFIAVGTREGKIYLVQEEEILWKKALPLPLEDIQVCPEGNCIIALLTDREKEKGVIIFMDPQGKVVWRKEMPQIFKMDMSTEGDIMAFLAEEEKDYTLYAFNKEGEPLWEKEGYLTLDVSHQGNYIAAASGEEIRLFSREGKEVWSYEPGAKITQLKISEDGEYLLAYNSFGGGEDNLFFFNMEGELLWQKRIRDDSLVDLSEDGQRIVVSSWRHYSEDFTLINCFDSQGRLRREIEVGSRAEAMALCREGKKLVLGCDDGNVYILNLDRETLGEYFPAGEEVFFYVPSQTTQENDDPRIDLFFYDENAMVLIPVSRKIGETNDLVQSALDELIRGPRANSYLVRTIPKGVDIEVKEEGNTLYINLPEELNRAGGTNYSLGVVNSILYTVSQFPVVEDVKFLVEGEEKDFFGDPGVYIGEAFDRRTIKKERPLIYLPYRSGRRYYLLPQEVFPYGEREDNPLNITEKYFKETSNYFTGEVRVYNVEIKDEVIYVNLSQDFLELFKGIEDPQLKARAQVVLEGLTHTLAGNFEPEKVQIYVEGEKVTPYPGFLNLNYPLNKSPYLNPEI
ncbi:MAG: hypothetical protein D5R97_08690 [Candidatus Syntrophonatronum acetioxidans]|uniref:GerMN domain-containing protein n=1 Tax=Candidatus Syntrophonatronum acetioxidans TaxID=1795816 RepID=A0A424YB53_9FIRM|nr:MAG: hypothetical protein D5R97_08690 [Candidatus Syntrophonatronum acetioxidans]